MRYCFCVTPFSPKQLHELDAIRARLFKAPLSLPASTSTGVVYLPHSKHGLGFKSLVPTYVQTAAETLVDCLNDKGALGVLTRALRNRYVKGLAAGARARQPPHRWPTRCPAGGQHARGPCASGRQPGYTSMTCS